MSFLPIYVVLLISAFPIHPSDSQTVVWACLLEQKHILLPLPKATQN